MHIRSDNHNESIPKMIFVCDEDWDEMRPCDSGRYCARCQHVVHDFTAGIPPATDTDGICGLFNTEQLHPDWVPLEFTWLNSFKKVLLAAVAFLGLEVTQASAQHDVKTDTIELVDRATKASATMVSKVDTMIDCKDGPEEHRMKRKWKRPSRIYLSWRFPFIRKRYVRVAGRFRH